MQHVRGLAKTHPQQRVCFQPVLTVRWHPQNMKVLVSKGRRRAVASTLTATVDDETQEGRVPRKEFSDSLLSWRLAVLRKHETAVSNHLSRTRRRPTGHNSSLYAPESSSSVSRRTGSCSLVAPRSCSRHTYATKSGRRSYSTSGATDVTSSVPIDTSAILDFFKASAAPGSRIPSAPDGSDDNFTIPRVSTRVRKARADAVRRVNAVMQKSFGTRFEVTVFGSTLYGTDTADSDLDLVILDQKRPKMLSPTDDEELRGPYNLQAVAATLRRAKRRSVPMFTNIETVGKAVVPIVKFKDTATRIYCDMNVNDQLGVLNTSLIMRYCILSPLVRPMMFVIKYWARHRGLNEPTGPQPAFNSYTLALMTIAFLQMRGLLPNIQSGHDGEYPDEDNYVWFRKVTRLTGEITHMKCDTFVRPMREFKPARDTPSLRQALVEWFDYWASEHDYSKTAVSVRDGGMIARMHIVTRHSSCPVTGDHLRPQALDEIAWDDGDVQMTRHREVATSNERMAFLRPPMCVHDPFIRLKNLTVAVSKQNVNQFKEGCAQASKLLQEGLPIQLLMSKRLAKCPVNIPTLEPSGGMSL